MAQVFQASPCYNGITYRALIGHPITFTATVLYHPGCCPTEQRALHGGGARPIGCQLPDADCVSQLRERLRAAGVPEVDWVEEEEGYSSVKVREPDGYVIECFWDIQ